MILTNQKVNQITFLFFFLVFFQTSLEKSYGQSNCPNSNFSMGNFTNWEGYYGNFYYPGANKGLITTGSNPRHMIIQSPGTQDPNTCGGLPTVPTGELYSARLGNDNVNREAEQLRYTTTVTKDNNLFIYKYAVVLQDPGHPYDEQPSFTIEVKNQNGDLFDSHCGYYYVYARQDLPGWHNCEIYDSYLHLLAKP